jgi:hypothetical protein
MFFVVLTKCGYSSWPVRHWRALSHRPMKFYSMLRIQPGIDCIYATEVPRATSYCHLGRCLRYCRYFTPISCVVDVVLVGFPLIFIHSYIDWTHFFHLNSATRRAQIVLLSSFNFLPEPTNRFISTMLLSPPIVCSSFALLPEFDIDLSLRIAQTWGLLRKISSVLRFHPTLDHLAAFCNDVYVFTWELHIRSKQVYAFFRRDEKFRLFLPINVTQCHPPTPERSKGTSCQASSNPIESHTQLDSRSRVWIEEWWKQCECDSLQLSL